NLTGLLADRAKETTGPPGEAIISRLRHGREIEAAHGHLLEFLEDADQAVEVRAEHLRRAAVRIGRLTAHIGTEDILGEIFSRFCIGK
ncbi:MAG: tRNA uridine-5-carboxymethylaminomethyl(34) synthesis GTPase MnmE, partial [Hyphomicrobiaceae bacterium]|nr:tRNA uridine-5-carboxymethylaminomethyl(34) synthesis GTPase MnmE [Hyphomicrobiaceae bacterium]